MLEILKAIVLGIVQGLTEFLPVSSSGHLVLLQQVFGMQESPIFLDSMLHMGTLIAVLWYLRRDIADILRRPFSKLTLMLVIATIPAVVFALFGKDFIDSAFTEGKYLGFEFILTGLILVVGIAIAKRRRAFKDTGHMRWYDAAGMGIAQAVSIMPAISRSGATISTGLALGYEREKIARFSFLMSIPAILGSFVFGLKDAAEANSIGQMSMVAVIVGTLFAAVAGYFAISFLMKVLTRGKLWWFAVYAAVLGSLVLLDKYALHIFF